MVLLMKQNSYLNKIKRKLILIFNSKLKFNLPKKNKLIIYDYDAEDKLRKILLKHYEYTILPHSGIFYFPILVYSILFLQHGLNAYKVAFLKYIKAEFILNWHDDYVKLSIPAKIAKCKLILIQNGYRDDMCIPYNKKKWNVDYYIVMCENWKKWITKRVNAQFLTFGSIINNQFEPVNDFPAVKKVLWISDFYSKDVTKDGSMRSLKKWEKEVLEPTRIGLKIINRFCQNNNLKLEVLLRQKGKSLEENKFFEEIGVIIDLDKNLYKVDYWNINYLKCTSDSIIVGNHETLGYELFGRGFRVAFFNFKSYLLKNDSYKFAWPQRVSDFGEFWCNTPDHLHLYSTLDYLKNVSLIEWKKQLELYKGVMHFEKNNIRLIQFLKSKGIKSNI